MGVPRPSGGRPWRLKLRGIEFVPTRGMHARATARVGSAHMPLASTMAELTLEACHGRECKATVMHNYDYVQTNHFILYKCSTKSEMGRWKRLCSQPPFKYFPPLGDPMTLGIVVVQVLWTTLVVSLYTADDELPFDVTTVFNILTATLGFILPLQLSTALRKNHSCVDNYNAFCGDVLAFAWECVALAKEDKVLHERQTELKNIFHILVALPAMVKHHFRGTMDINMTRTLGSSKFSVSNGLDAQGEIHALYTQLVENAAVPGMGEVEICFMKLLDYVKDFAAGDSVDPVRRSLVRTWDRVYGAWGNMGNITSYTPPSIYTYVLNLALLLWSLILPITLYAQGFNAVWMVLLISYFFLGLNIAGQKVGNAFVASEDAVGFQNVTGAQKNATAAIEQVWDVRKPVASKYARRDLSYF